MLKHLDEGKMTLEREIDKILKTGDISVSTLEKLHKLTDTYKNMCKIEMYAELEDGGESYEDGVSYARGGRGRGRNAKRDSMGRYSREGDYSMTDGYSDEGSSYARGGRGGQGGSRGTYRGGYSRTDAKEEMVEQIEMMMKTADPKSKKILMECMENLEMD